MVKNIDPNVVLKKLRLKTQDHITLVLRKSKIIGFETNLTIERSTRFEKSFEKKLLINTFNSELFFNIKRTSIKLK